jgi:hypothetical protein
MQKENHTFKGYLLQQTNQCGQEFAAVGLGKKDYDPLHSTFQSTSLCNIHTLDALNFSSMYVQKQEEGRGNNKHHWGIKMNDAGFLYLGA